MPSILIRGIRLIIAHQRNAPICKRNHRLPCTAPTTNHALPRSQHPIGVVAKFRSGSALEELVPRGVFAIGKALGAGHGAVAASVGVDELEADGAGEAASAGCRCEGLEAVDLEGLRCTMGGSGLAGGERRREGGWSQGEEEG